MPDTLVVCFALNYQSIKGALAAAQSVREQRPDMRIFPVPMRIDGSEEKLLNRMKSYAASVFLPLLNSKIDATEYWFSMERQFLTLPDTPMPRSWHCSKSALRSQRPLCPRWNACADILRMKTCARRAPCLIRSGSSR